MAHITIERSEPGMNDEASMVLRMLAEGKISVDDANRLLDALGSSPQGEDIEQTQPPPPPSVKTAVITQPAVARNEFTLRQIMQLSEHGVEPEFIAAVREA